MVASVFQSSEFKLVALVFHACRRASRDRGTTGDELDASTQTKTITWAASSAAMALRIAARGPTF